MFFYFYRNCLLPSPLPGYRVGAALIVLSLLLFLHRWFFIDSLSSNDQMFFSALTLVFFIVGLIVLFFGTEMLRKAPFPFVFLLFAAPLPEAVLNRVIFFLQISSAETVNLLFHLTGTEFIRTGSVFHLQDLSIHIAPECSGIRSSLSLFLAGIIAAELFLRKKRYRLLLLMSIVPITVFKNAVRIVALTLLSIHVDPSFLFGPLHTQGGKPIFVFALILLGGVLFALMRIEKSRKNVIVIRQKGVIEKVEVAGK
ncbi:Eight transmembrane protein EpsH [Chitinispirillum alkaliphilum]|nr:Eight transmembrane protein EpsH [Chitinispirillum alkaliphilum]